MRFMKCLAFALLATFALSGGPAFARVCQTAKLACATTMPMGGFCQCTAHGMTEDGTVMSKAKPHQVLNATAGGCGTHPTAPGCAKASNASGSTY